jgi:uncharacterized protein YdeI (YjbR/CyaY-like superfamily)
MKSAESVVSYIDSHPSWKESLIILRSILLETELEETIKWGAPAYTIEGKNVVGIGAFKSYVGLWFHQGVFLKDPKKLLINAQEGSTKALRQLRFSSSQDIDTKTVKAYIHEAIENQKAGMQIKPVRSTSYEMPEELNKKLKSDSHLEDSFLSLSYGKQKEFAAYINEAKQSTTREKRLLKSIPLILEKVGLNDKYRKK